MTSRTPRLAALALVAALALAGCGTYPGQAAVVGPVRISSTQVDAVAASLCAANVAGGTSGGPVASSGARQGALQVLIDSELSRQFGQSRGIKPPQSQIQAAVDRNSSTLQTLPADRRGAFRDALTRYATGQLMLLIIGRRELATQGAANITDTQAIAAGSKLRSTYEKKIDVSVDPRYGTFSRGVLSSGSGSLSAPASGNALEALQQNPSPTFLASLPASQTCRA